ncbi:MAG: hypothetical protein MUP98_20560 [Candidatus Aminicenantes bacterium]|nr:hypothetical protein [Candidatus Aminicenantes bacterium]
MDFISSILDLALNAFGKSGGIPAPASGSSLIGTLLYLQYSKEAPDVWDLFMGGLDLESSRQSYNVHMADKLDMTPDEFLEFRESDYGRSLDEVNRWKKNHPDPMDVLIDIVMEQTKGK